jgi:hypothetical protein
VWDRCRGREEGGRTREDNSEIESKSCRPRLGGGNPAGLISYRDLCSRPDDSLIQTGTGQGRVVGKGYGSSPG